jgi:hypothetical protein
MIVDLPLAPLSILAFLGMCLFVVAMFLLIAGFQISGKSNQARTMLKFLLAGMAVYAFALMVRIDVQQGVRAGKRRGKALLRDGLPSRVFSNKR